MTDLCIVLYSTGQNLDYVIEYFTEHSLHDTVKSTEWLPENEDRDFYAVRTTGAFYFVVPVSTSATSHDLVGTMPEHITDAIEAVALKQWTMSYSDSSQKAEITVNNAEAFCQEIADLAALLSGEIVTTSVDYSNDLSKCILKW